MSTSNPYYFCYSVKLYREIKSHNIYYIAKGTNPSTNKDFWVFEKTETLKQILINWSNHKCTNVK